MKTLLDQLQQLAPLAANATPAPWTNAGAGTWHSQEGYFIETADNEPICEVFGNTVNKQGDEYGEHDAAFIAAARNLLTPDNLALLVAALNGAQAHEVLTSQRDGALLYAEACDRRLRQLIEVATRPLPTCEEMMATPHDAR